MRLGFLAKKVWRYPFPTDLSEWFSRKIKTKCYLSTKCFPIMIRRTVMFQTSNSQFSTCSNNFFFFKHFYTNVTKYINNVILNTLKIRIIASWVGFNEFLNMTLVKWIWDILNRHDQWRSQGIKSWGRQLPPQIWTSQIWHDFSF